MLLKNLAKSTFGVIVTNNLKYLTIQKVYSFTNTYP